MWHGTGKVFERLVVELRVLGWEGKVAQIKEKYGTLRFYAQAASEPMRICTCLSPYRRQLGYLPSQPESLGNRGKPAAGRRRHLQVFVYFVGRGLTARS